MTDLISIDSDFKSFQQIIELYHEHKDDLFETIEVNIKDWFKANMCSALGAVLEFFSKNLNTIEFTFSDKKIENILLRNNFLSFFEYGLLPDSNQTTIKYLRLNPNDGKYFKKYVVSELVSREGMPNMSFKVSEKITESIYEIFVNAQIHSESPSIFTCGQYFPNMHLIEFTITDIGIGFKNKINSRFKTNLNSVQAIKWAVADKNTTKVETPGGIGLALLKEFVHLNKGRMQIISDDGYYVYDSERERTKLFDKPFPGTIVNLQFKTNDASLYVTSDEVDQDNIF